MVKMIKLFYPVMMVVFFSCNENDSNERVGINQISLQDIVEQIVVKSSADVGVVIIGPDNDTVKVHPHKPYRMQSVAKFPQALRLLKMVDEGKLSRDFRFIVTEEEMKQRTYSTLPKDHPICPFELSIREALDYSIGQSDNVMSNMIFDAEGGPDEVEKFIRDLGITGIGVKVDYWHLTNETAYYNWSTPMSMAILLEKFHQGKILSAESQKLLHDVMVKGPAGRNRIRGLLPDSVAVAHKTGTGNTDDISGRIMALNDVGIIELPDGRHITIAVFISDSFESDENTAAIIANISKAAVDYYNLK